MCMYSKLLTWVAEVYVKVYGRRTLIKNRDQTPLVTSVQKSVWRCLLLWLIKSMHLPIYILRYSARKNLVLDSVSEAVSELKLFHQAGGGTICDVTTVGIRCHPESLPQISRESGVNIVMGSGYYVGSYLPPEDVKLMTSNEVRSCSTKKITQQQFNIKQILWI